MAFRFKKFKIEDDRSAMKVGTDGVLLGASVQSEQEKRILDIGTGSGLIALMLAQKSKAQIDAIDLDEFSIKQAKENFNRSPWAGQLNAIHDSLQNFCKKAGRKYDLIVSNPPFFDQSLKSYKQSKNISKHTDSLKFEELASSIKQLLKKAGKAQLILPPAEAELLIHRARIEGLYCNKRIKICPLKGKAYNRLIFTLSFYQKPTEEQEISIRETDYNYSSEYKAFTKDYYLNF